MIVIVATVCLCASSDPSINVNVYTQNAEYRYTHWLGKDHKRWTETLLTQSQLEAPHFLDLDSTERRISCQLEFDIVVEMV
jgi:hypothetical protein